MKKKTFDEKIKSKYGVDSSSIKDLSISKIRELKLHNIVEKKLGDKYKIVKKPLGVLVKGGSLGVAGAVNSAFPNIVPVIGSAFTQAQEFSWYEKALGYATFASKPVDIISGPMIVGIGAAVGVVLYGGYTLVKSTVDTLAIVKDRKNAKKLSRK